VEVIKYEVLQVRAPERSQLWGSAKPERELAPELHHFVQFKNATDRRVVAVQFGIVGFDLWNRFLEQTITESILDIEPGANGEATYVIYHSPGGTFLSGAIYVRKVRFEDGEIWFARLPEIAAHLSGIEREFASSRLEDPKRP
jgi:hypothetical protein